MSDRESGAPQPMDAGENDAASERDDDAMRALVKRAGAASPGHRARAPSLVRGVQGKIRRRSQGKFFADGWSTGRSRMSTALVAAIMLLLIAVAYFALGPIGISAR